jgi:flavin reductase (DIM6/NTAB) family NADH-FMN oxidoreductase RutF
MVKKWMKITLIIAGIYNIIWGSWVIFFPTKAFEWTGAKVPAYPQIWQCVGMIVAVYGAGYLIASTSPIKHWPITFVGLLGKVFGPIGFIYSITQDIFPLAFGWIIVFNDLIWWIPFGLILAEVWRSNSKKAAMIGISKQEFENFEDKKRAKSINSLSGYKSSNLIGTQDTKGATNLSIVSSVFHLGASPALIGFIIRPNTVRRDTLENIKQTGNFTINHVNRNIIKQSHQTSARYDKGESEFEKCGLKEEYFGEFSAPFVSESNIKIAVKFVREEKLEENGVHLIIGSIQKVYLPDGLISEDGNIELHRAGTVAVSGLDTYVEAFPFGRLSYAKTDKWPQWLK